MKTNTMTILGSGTSTGIPMVGCRCNVCTSSENRNTRLRTSVHIETAKGTNFIIDTGPDLRAQLLTNSIEKVDFAFITHDHADHTHGIDDLRPLCFGPPAKEIPIYTYKDCFNELREKFSYIFKAHEIFSKDRPPLGGGIPRLKLESIDTSKKQSIQGEEFEFLLLNHGYTKTLGIIHEKMAYLIDCHEITADQLEMLNKLQLELLIIDCVTIEKNHKSHLSDEKCFEYIEKISPKRAGLIHMNHTLEHNALEAKAKSRLKTEVFVTYDTQQLSY